MQVAEQTDCCLSLIYESRHFLGSHNKVRLTERCHSLPLRNIPENLVFSKAETSSQEEEGEEMNNGRRSSARINGRENSKSYFKALIGLPW